MDTRLSIRTTWVKDTEGKLVYKAVLVDGGVEVDTLIFSVTNGTVETAIGYAKTIQGARRQAQDHWF